MEDETRQDYDMRHSARGLRYETQYQRYMGYSQYFTIPYNYFSDKFMYRQHSADIYCLQKVTYFMNIIQKQMKL